MATVALDAAASDHTTSVLSCPSLFSALVLKHILPIAEILSSSLEKKAGVLDWEQQTLTTQPDRLEENTWSKLIQCGLGFCLLMSVQRKRKWTKWDLGWSNNVIPETVVSTETRPDCDILDQAVALDSRAESRSTAG